jgi:hypothetical protein
MYPVTIQAVYMMDRVEADSRAVARAESMIAALGLKKADVHKISDEDLPEVIAEHAWQRAWVRQGLVEEHRPHYVVFNAFNFDGRTDRAEELRKSCPEGTSAHLCLSLLGYVRYVSLAHPRAQDQDRNCVCWPEREFITIEGCPHRCLYCGSGQLINLMVNLEEFADRILVPTLAEHEWQKCYRCNTTASDTLCFEPEYGLHDLFTELFAEFGDRYLFIHTKSANVDFIAELPHKEHLIGVWSITSQPGSMEVEPGSATALERIEAARKCQEMGLAVRFKFKPIVPLRGWREQYATIIEEMFRHTSPEAVGFCVLMWMDYAAMIDALGAERLDPEYVEAARLAAEEMKGQSVGPFPHHVRAEIYRFFIEQVRRHDKHVPLFISTESREMWEELGPVLGANPARFVCACGPISVPGPRLAGTQTSTFVPREEVEPNEAP